MLPGDRIENWVIVHQLGEGGFGSVYRCHQTGSERIVAAIKVLNLGGDADMRRRFLREAEILYGLEHPNVVRLRTVRAEATPA